MADDEGLADAVRRIHDESEACTSPRMHEISFALSESMEPCGSGVATPGAHALSSPDQSVDSSTAFASPIGTHLVARMSPTPRPRPAQHTVYLSDAAAMHGDAPSPLRVRKAGAEPCTTTMPPQLPRTAGAVEDVTTAALHESIDFSSMAELATRTSRRNVGTPISPRAAQASTTAQPPAASLRQPPPPPPSARTVDPRAVHEMLSPTPYSRTSAVLPPPVVDSGARILQMVRHAMQSVQERQDMHRARLKYDLERAAAHARRVVANAGASTSLHSNLAPPVGARASVSAECVDEAADVVPHASPPACAAEAERSADVPSARAASGSACNAHVPVDSNVVDIERTHIVTEAALIAAAATAAAHMQPLLTADDTDDSSFSEVARHHPASSRATHGAAAAEQSACHADGESAASVSQCDSLDSSVSYSLVEHSIAHLLDGDDEHARMLQIQGGRGKLRTIESSTGEAARRRRAASHVQRGALCTVREVAATFLCPHCGHITDCVSDVREGATAATRLCACALVPPQRDACCQTEQLDAAAATPEQSTPTSTAAALVECDAQCTVHLLACAQTVGDATDCGVQVDPACAHTTISASPVVKELQVAATAPIDAAALHCPPESSAPLSSRELVAVDERLLIPGAPSPLQNTDASVIEQAAADCCILNVTTTTLHAAATLHAAVVEGSLSKRDTVEVDAELRVAAVSSHGVDTHAMSHSLPMSEADALAFMMNDTTQLLEPGVYDMRGGALMDHPANSFLASTQPAA
ncbi:MAG: hypothetical protein EOO41_01650, partial [Methanobacteriota archaeon]